MKLLWLGLLFVLSFSTVARAEVGAQSLQEDYQFVADEQLPEALESKLQAAKKANKKLLLVLGGKWCHDSAALAKNFNHDAVHTILQSHYETLFVSVGYLDKGFDVAQRFGLPVYYGTPTVMVIDPNTERLLNRNSMWPWLSAASVELAEYQRYFSALSRQPASKSDFSSLRLGELLAQIDTFEAQQAKRVRRAYERLGPVLKSYKEDGVAFGKEKDLEWEAVGRFRYGLLKTVSQMREQAQAAVANNEDFKLTFPTYEKFVWE